MDILPYNGKSINIKSDGDLAITSVQIYLDFFYKKSVAQCATLNDYFNNLK